MRVLIDTNVFISHLLTPQQSGVVYAILEAALSERFVLLLPQDLLTEIETTVVNKPYLSRRISQEALAALLSVLRLAGEEIPRIASPIPATTRDPKDDYLIAYAVVGEADYLVTGDKDLLAIGKIDTIPILTPKQFAEIVAA